MKVLRVKTATAPKLTSDHIPFKKEEYSPKAEPDFFKQNFTCAGQSKTTQNPCKAAVRAFPRHRRQGREVLGHFYLAPGAQHVEECSEDIVTKGKELVVKHRDLITYDNYKFVLTFPSKEQWNLPQGANATSLTGQDATGAEPQVATKTKPSNRTRARYIMMVVSEVAALLDEYQDDAEARVLFAIQYQGRTLTWDNFFHDARWGTESIYEQACKNEGSKEEIPLTVYGRIWRVYEARGTGKNHSVVIANTQKTLAPNGKITSLKIYTQDPEVLDLTPGTIFLGLGFWAPWVDHPEQLRIFAAPDCYMALEGEVEPSGL